MAALVQKKKRVWIENKKQTKNLQSFITDLLCRFLGVIQQSDEDALRLLDPGIYNTELLSCWIAVVAAAGDFLRKSYGGGGWPGFCNVTMKSRAVEAEIIIIIIIQ